MRNTQLPGRSVVMSTEAMAATSQPMATEAALQVLRDGGNAMDAAIALQWNRLWHILHGNGSSRDQQKHPWNASDPWKTAYYNYGDKEYPSQKANQKKKTKNNTEKPAIPSTPWTDLVPLDIFTPEGDETSLALVTDDTTTGVMMVTLAELATK